MITAHIDALQAISPIRLTLQRRILHQLAFGNYTADELATILGVSIMTVRPRVAELYKRGYLEETIERRKNQSGKRATVWSIKENDQQQFLPLAVNNNETGNARNERQTINEN